MNSPSKLKIWAAIGAVSAVIWGIFLIAMIPDPQPVDEQLESFSSIAKANDKWHRGVLLHRMGDLDAAQKLYDEALVELPEEPLVYLFRGRVEYDRGNYDGAIAIYNQWLDKEPDFSWALNARAIAKYKKGDKAGCMADLERAIEVDPKYAGPIMNKGVIKKLEGDLEGAMELVNQASNMEPGAIPDRLTWSNIADIQFEMGNFAESKKALDVVIRHHPEYFPAYSHRARVLRQMGETTLAQQDEAAYAKLRKEFEDSMKDLKPGE